MRIRSEIVILAGIAPLLLMGSAFGSDDDGSSSTELEATLTVE
jgi:hypothetical protein